MTDLGTRRALPVTIVPGMPVFDTADCQPSTIVGIAQAFCVYRLNQTETLCVANWRDVALGNVCPAEPLLPADVTENDRQNARATALRELLGLKRLGPLTPVQVAAQAELIAYLCGELSPTKASGQAVHPSPS